MKFKEIFAVFAFGVLASFGSLANEETKLKHFEIPLVFSTDPELLALNYYCRVTVGENTMFPGHIFVRFEVLSREPFVPSKGGFATIIAHSSLPLKNGMSEIKDLEVASHKQSYGDSVFRVAIIPNKIFKGEGSIEYTTTPNLDEFYHVESRQALGDEVKYHFICDYNRPSKN